MTREKPGFIAALVGAIGAQVIYLLIRLFGRTHRREDIAWLVGPLGGPVIGDATYREVGEAEGLVMERDARQGGLVPSFEVLGSPSFDVGRVHPKIRDFYEHTARYAMNVWSRVYFPASIALWLLVKTISRQVNQLNFPLSPLDTARGMHSEIIVLRTPDGALRYTGWSRRLAQDDQVVYTGFYMTQVSPTLGTPCVKAVFPMPSGNATVVLRPEVTADGALVLDSSGRRFGDAGFYRVQAVDADRLRVWQITTLKERFRMYVDETGTVRCDHSVRFLGLPVLALHYEIFARDDG